MKMLFCVALNILIFYQSFKVNAFAQHISPLPLRIMNKRKIMPTLRSTLLRCATASLLLLGLAGSYTHAAEADNYCHDKTALDEWQALLSKYPDDADIIKLYALRSGLCAMVERDQLALDRAIAIFEAERVRIITEKQWDRERLQSKHGA